MMQWCMNKLLTLKNNKRQLAFEAFDCIKQIIIALLIYKGLMLITQCEAPLTAVLSESMEPALYRGDALLVHNWSFSPIEVGDIVVYRVEGRKVPIVHRVLERYMDLNGRELYLTKGDNNKVDDRGLYPKGQDWLERKDIMGKVYGYVPLLGYPSILLSIRDYVPLPI